MEENRFFRFVWRFNGIILMIVGILAIGVLAFAGYQFYAEFTRDRVISNVVNIEKNSEVEEDWQLGYMREVQGTPYIAIPLNSEQSYARSSYGSKSSSSPRNYLFINSTTNEQYWLFNQNTFLISNTKMLYGPEGDNKEKKVQAILYQIIKEDTNKDNRLTKNDSETIAISQYDGRGYKELIEGIDRIIGHRAVNDNTLLIIYQKKGIGYSAHVRLSDFTLQNERELPKVTP